MSGYESHREVDEGLGEPKGGRRGTRGGKEVEEGLGEPPGGRCEAMRAAWRSM